MLSFLPKNEPHPDLLVGLETSDDAGVYRLADGLALVQTVDYFTPIVDDPYDFGQIAAANALSDIYAMGGKPLTALNIVGFPISRIEKWVLAEILRGGADKVREAGAVLLGGHSIDDTEPKYGMAVTGIVDPRRVWTNAGAQDGDALVLTKPIGMGVVTKAIKEGVATESEIAEATRWMALLNRSAADAARSFDVHAATDVTGFGLLGHAYEMVRGSGLGLRLSASAVAILPGALAYAAQGLLPAGSKRNRQFVAPAVQWDDAIDNAHGAVLADAVTSGGLLLALPGKQAEDLVRRLHGAGLTAAAVVGGFSAQIAGRMIVNMQ